MNDHQPPDYLYALTHLCTPEEPPWTDREHVTDSDADPRTAFERDRDRIIHSEHFRRLQQRAQTQVPPFRGTTRSGIRINPASQGYYIHGVIAWRSMSAVSAERR